MIILGVVILSINYIPNIYRQYVLKAWGSVISMRGHIGRSCIRSSVNKKVKYPKNYEYKGYDECLKNVVLKTISTDEIKTMGVYRGITDYGISCEFTLGIYYNGWDDWCEVAWFYTHDNIPLGEATSLRAP